MDGAGPERRRASILVIDDEPANLLLARTVLERSGHHVTSAASAEEALQIVAGMRPDLVLVDVQLPGMDGLEFTRRLRSDPLTAGLAIVALTAHQMPLLERTALGAGCSGFLTKPASPNLLALQVEELLGTLVWAGRSGAAAGEIGSSP